MPDQILQIAKKIIDSTDCKDGIRPEKVLFCVGPSLFYEMKIEELLCQTPNKI